MTIPKHITEAVSQWPGYWAAVDLRPDGLQVRYYDNGEATANYSRGGPRDYYLWSVTRQVRLRSWRRAQDMWAHAAETLRRGPDRYGLVRLSA